MMETMTRKRRSFTLEDKKEAALHHASGIHETEDCSVFPTV